MYQSSISLTVDMERSIKLTVVMELEHGPTSEIGLRITYHLHMKLNILTRTETLTTHVQSYLVTDMVLRSQIPIGLTMGMRNS